RRLMEEGRKFGIQVTLIGVALDWDINAGLRFLQSAGRFDEISVGRNWLNSHAVSHIWRDLPGPPVIPQIVVVDRTVRVDNDFITISIDSVVSRVVGVD